MDPATPKSPTVGGTSHTGSRPQSSTAWYTALWQCRAARTLSPRRVAPRTAASRAPVEPLTWYRVSPLPKSRAARAMLSARIPAGAWRSSKPGSSVISSPAPRVLR